MILLEENRNTITYDDNWQNVTEPEIPVFHAPNENNSNLEYSEPEEAPPKEKTPPRQLLITLQLVICALLALSAFILKSMGGEWYHTVREWYYTRLNSAAIFEGDDSFSVSSLFGKASTDEA